MLQPDPADRPNSMAEIAEWQPQAEPPPSRARRAPKPPARVEPSPARNEAGRARSEAPPSRKSPLRTGAFAAIALALLGIGGAGLYFMLATDQPSPKPSGGAALTPSDTKQTSPDIQDVKTTKQTADLRAQQIKDYINSYDGGACFFVTPPQIDEKKAAVDGLFGISQAPFDKLSDDFERDMKIELEIGLHGVTREQCPAVNFLWQMRNQRVPAPHLDISSDTIPSGSEITGRVTDFGNRNIYLLLVADDGDVWNLTDRLRPNGDAKNFAVGLQRYPTALPPKLLITVTADRPLGTIDALSPLQAGNSDTVFPQLLAEAARQSINVSFRYFRLK
jgi:hypothetical protein